MFSIGLAAIAATGRGWYRRPMLWWLPFAHATELARPAEIKAARQELQGLLPSCKVRRVDHTHLGADCADGRVIRLDLERLGVVCEQDAATCAHERKVLVHAALHGHPPTDLAVVVPTLRARRWVDGTLALIERVKSEGRDARLEAPVHRALSADIEIVYMIDGAESARALNTGDLIELDLATDGLHAATVGNCARFAGEVTRDQAGAVEVWQGGFYVTSLALDLSRWDAEAAGAPLYLAVPDRGMLLVSRGDEVAALRERAAMEYERAPNPVSRGVLRWTGAGWEPVGD